MGETTNWIEWRLWIPESKTERVVVYECRNPGDQNPTFQRMEKTHQEVEEMLNSFKLDRASMSRPIEFFEMTNTRRSSDLCDSNVKEPSGVREAILRHRGGLEFLHQSMTQLVGQVDKSILQDSESAGHAGKAKDRESDNLDWLIPYRLKGSGWVGACMTDEDTAKHGLF